MKRWILGFLAATLSVPLQAVIITEQYNFALPTASGIYGAGHMFQITATYDNTGSERHTWHDGPNGTAQFGAPDDTLHSALSLTSYPGYTILSDAVISISGLLLPGDALPADAQSFNRSDVSVFGDRYAAGSFEIQLQADDLFFRLSISGPEQYSSYPEGRTILELHQYYIRAGQTRFSDQHTSITLPTFLEPSDMTSVPEPSTLALLGLGLAGFGLARRRTGQKSTV